MTVSLRRQPYTYWAGAGSTPNCWSNPRLSCSPQFSTNVPFASHLPILAQMPNIRRRNIITYSEQIFPTGIAFFLLHSVAAAYS